MKLNVNAKAQTVAEDYREEPLLWALRDGLGLTGTHYGCGIGRCGSCMVLVDDQPTRSCQTPTESIGTSTITTIEGLASLADSAPSSLHFMQEAFLEFPLQCMWCLPGHIMTAVALIEANPNPTELDIETAIAENLCRCGGYNQIRKAIASGAERKRNA
jgi:aerobic-type carbon monoxide dehydrogenase small subunit (CoxS/CutS family)